MTRLTASPGLDLFFRSSSASLFVRPQMAIEYPRRRPPLHNEPLDMDGPDAHSDHYQSDDDDDDTNSDTSDAVVEVSADEFPGYFQERGGRLFHSHGRSPYPLPVDAEEHEVSRAQGPGGTHGAAPGRLRAPPFSFAIMHPTLWLTWYFSATKRAKSASAQAHRRFLCGARAGATRRRSRRAATRLGSRNWHRRVVRHPAWLPRTVRIFYIDCRINRVLDMAREFPRVRFYGVDIGWPTLRAHA